MSKWPGMRERYRLKGNQAWRGGFCEVLVAAPRDGRSRHVAIKRLISASDPEARARLKREIEIMGDLADCRHVMPVLDKGDGESWYVMPLADGTLEERYTEMSGEDVAAAIQQVAIGLEAAHTSGHLHRDVKPSNILRMRGERWVLADFGLVKRPPGFDTSFKTQTDAKPGTYGYIAPEVLRGAEHTVTADIFALGRAHGFALTGRHADPGESHDVSGPYRQLIKDATDKNPGRRPQSAREYREQLARVASANRPLPIDEAQSLLRGSDALLDMEDAQYRVIQLALDNPENDELWLDALPRVGIEALGVLVAEDPDQAVVLATRVHRMMTEEWGDRPFSSLGTIVSFVRSLCRAALTLNRWNAAEDLARHMFDVDADARRFDERRSTFRFLEEQRGQAAEAIARGLLASPRGRNWLTEEGWVPSSAAHASIRRALQGR